MLHQARIEIAALVNHVLKISLYHESHIDLGEELLASRVDCDSLLQFLELPEMSNDGLVGLLHDFLLVGDALEHLVKGLLLDLEYLVLGLGLLVHLHEGLSDVDIGQLLHSLGQNLLLLHFSFVDGVEGLLNGDGAGLLGDVGSLLGVRHHFHEFLLGLRQNVEVVLLTIKPLSRRLILSLGHLDFLLIALNVGLIRLVNSPRGQDGPLGRVGCSHLIIEVLLALHGLLAFLKHHYAVLAHVLQRLDGTSEVVDGTLLLELIDLILIAFRDILNGCQLMVALRQLILAEEHSLLLVRLLEVLVLLVNQVLDLGSELSLHLPDLGRDHVSKSLVHGRNSSKLGLHSVIELDEVLLVRKLGLLWRSNRFKEHFLSLVGRHCGHVVSLLHLCFVVSTVLRSNLVNVSLACLEELSCSLGGTSSDSHITAFFLRLRES